MTEEGGSITEKYSMANLDSLAGSVEFFLMRKKILPKVWTVEEAICKFQRVQNHDDGGEFFKASRPSYPVET